MRRSSSASLVWSSVTAFNPLLSQTFVLLIEDTSAVSLFVDVASEFTASAACCHAWSRVDNFAVVVLFSCAYVSRGTAYARIALAMDESPVLITSNVKPIGDEEREDG